MTIINASSWAAQCGGDTTILVTGTVPSVPDAVDAACDPQMYRGAVGPFACVTHDTGRRETVLARDYLGQQPLYYCRSGNRLIVGGTLPDILQHLPSRPAWNTTEIAAIVNPASPYSNDTIFVGISRVEPGHIVHLRPDGTVRAHPFWRLDPHGPSLTDLSDDAILERFSELLAKAVRDACMGQRSVAAEFSAGVDSTAVAVAARAQGIPVHLFMHTPVDDSPEDAAYDRRIEHAVLRSRILSGVPLHRVDGHAAAGFDPLEAMARQARLFGGPAPYLFTVFAEPVMQAVAGAGHPVLLSGFGGDQGVSDSVPERRPTPHWWQRIWRKARAGHTDVDAHQLRACECDRLQGPGSRELRLRIESSAIVARALGFVYRYPLLSAPLLEFYVSLLPSQKRRGRKGRWLIRRFLAGALEGPLFHRQNKRNGLPILPATLPTFLRQVIAGHGGAAFDAVRTARGPADAHSRLVEAVRDYMMTRAAG